MKEVRVTRHTVFFAATLCVAASVALGGDHGGHSHHAGHMHPSGYHHYRGGPGYIHPYHHPSHPYYHEYLRPRFDSGYGWYGPSYGPYDWDYGYSRGPVHVPDYHRNLSPSADESKGINVDRAASYSDPRYRQHIIEMEK